MTLFFLIMHLFFVCVGLGFMAIAIWKVITDFEMNAVGVFVAGAALVALNTVTSLNLLGVL